MKDNYIRFDWSIKRLLRQKANFGVLEGFFTVLLDEKVEIIEMLESNDQMQNYYKFNRVDIKAKNSKGEIIIVEVQNIHEMPFRERVVYDATKGITEHLSLDESYYEAKKIYSISIFYFDIGKGNDYLYHGQNIFTGVHTGDRLEVSVKGKYLLVHKLPAELLPEYFLIRVNEFNQVAVTPLEEWLGYLKDGTIRPDTTVPGLMEAREKLLYHNMSDGERYAYNEYLSDLMIQNDALEGSKLEGFQEGLEEIRQQRLQQGVLQERNEIAANMKKLGLDIPLISQATGLTPEEIAKL